MMLVQTNFDDLYYMRTSCFHGGRRNDEITWDEMTEKASPAPAVIGKKKKVVTFCTDMNQVVEYENEITKDDSIPLFWYDKNDGPEDFTKVSIMQTSKPSTRSQESMLLQSICYNHSRRVLLNYESYKGMSNGSELLRNISRRSSKARRNEARREAVSVSKALQTLDRPLFDDIFHELGLDSRIVDFYIACIADNLMVPNWLCGALWTTE